MKGIVVADDAAYCQAKDKYAELPPILGLLNSERGSLKPNIQHFRQFLSLFKLRLPHPNEVQDANGPENEAHSFDPANGLGNTGPQHPSHKFSHEHGFASTHKVSNTTGDLGSQSFQGILNWRNLLRTRLGRISPIDSVDLALLGREAKVQCLGKPIHVRMLLFS